MSQPPPQISEVPNVQYQLQPILVKVRIKKKKKLALFIYFCLLRKVLLNYDLYYFKKENIIYFYARR